MYDPLKPRDALTGECRVAMMLVARLLADPGARMATGSSQRSWAYGLAKTMRKIGEM
jgi:hypothetical protein